MTVQRSYESLYAFLGNECLYDYKKNINLAVLGINYEAEQLSKDTDANSSLSKLRRFVKNCQKGLSAPAFKKL